MPANVRKVRISEFNGIGTTLKFNEAGDLLFFNNEWREFHPCIEAREMRAFLNWLTEEMAGKTKTYDAHEQGRIPE